MAQSNNTVNFLIHDANGQPQFIKVVQAQANPNKPISVVGSAIANQAVKAIIKNQDSNQSGTTVLTASGQVLRTIGIPATKNTTGQRTTHVVTIPFQQSAGGSSGTGTKLLMSSPHKVVATTSPSGDQLILPRNAKLIATPSPSMRQTVLARPETTKSVQIASPVSTLDGNKLVRNLNLSSGPKHYISPILDHTGARKRQEVEPEYILPEFLPTMNVSLASTVCSPGGKRRKTEKGGKGLRHFSKKVCEKVRRKGTTSYNEVADELVTEFTNPANCLGTPADQLSVLQYDQKNIRRRVYDALNVLMAMNIISKEKKEIRWLGLPTNSQQECVALEKDKLRRVSSITHKMQQLQELILQQIAFKNLVERNRETEAANGPPGPNSSIQLPFILVHTAKDTTIDCSISNDKREYLFNFDNKFEFHDDMEVLKRMGLSLGLEKGECSPEDLERARNLVPPSLEPYVVQLASGKLEPEFPVEVRPGPSLSRRHRVAEGSSHHHHGMSAEDIEVANAVGQLSRQSSHTDLSDPLRPDSVSPYADFSEEESDGSSDLEIN